MAAGVGLADALADGAGLGLGDAAGSVGKSPDGAAVPLAAALGLAVGVTGGGGAEVQAATRAATARAMTSRITGGSVTRPDCAGVRGSEGAIGAVAAGADQPVLAPAAAPLSGVAVKSPERIRRAFSITVLRNASSCSGVRVVLSAWSFSVK